MKIKKNPSSVHNFLTFRWIFQLWRKNVTQSFFKKESVVLCFSRCEVPEEPEDEDEALMAPTYKKTFKKQQ